MITSGWQTAAPSDGDGGRTGTYVAVNLPLAVSRRDGATPPPVAYVAVNLPLAGLQRSTYRYMSGLQQQSAYRYMSTAVLYRYMASAVSYNRCATHERSSGPFCPGLPVSPPCVSRLSASTSGPFLVNGQRHLRQRRRRPIIRGMVHRFAKASIIIMVF